MKSLSWVIAMTLSGAAFAVNVHAQEGTKREQPAGRQVNPSQNAAGKDAMRGIVGTYKIVSGESDGKATLPERLTDVSVRITEKTITTYDKDKQERYNASYTVDMSTKPWKITMVPTQVPPRIKEEQQKQEKPATGSEAGAQGLVEKTDKGLKLIYALPGGAAPNGFKTKAKQNMFVLESLKDVTDPKAADRNATDRKATDRRATDEKATDQKATDRKPTDRKATDAKATDPKDSTSKKTVEPK